MIAGRGRRWPLRANPTSAPTTAVGHYPHDAYTTRRSPEFFSSLIELAKHFK